MVRVDWDAERPSALMLPLPMAAIEHSNEGSPIAI